MSHADKNGPQLIPPGKEILAPGWPVTAFKSGSEKEHVVCLHDIFERQADLVPESIALEASGRVFTYAALEQRANQVAHLLHARGIGSGDYVAIQLPRTPELYVFMLGILKAGAAYVPLDPTCPTERVKYILRDCEVSALVTDATLASVLVPLPVEVLLVEAVEKEFASQPVGRLPRAATKTSAHDVAYVIYTSGSTGQPKGVQIEHASICHLVQAEAGLFQVTPCDRVYQGFSVAFDASLEEIWLAFAAGATLVAATPEMACAGPALSSLLTRAQVTVLSCVPTLLSMLEPSIPTLRLLILGGETCPPELVKRWSRHGLRIVNTYGPTETTVIATYSDCRPDKEVTIGRAVPGYEIYLLDENVQPVPIGRAGEIYIGGPGVARGYVGRPDLTGARFISNPFGVGRLYRSGDLGEWTESGEVRFRGRSDGQVKLRGFRIELSEIENVLRTCPGVRAAVVALKEDGSGQQQLVGYLIREHQEVQERAVRHHLQSILPRYMVPTYLEFVEDFPTLPSGKIDRSRLAMRQQRPPEESAMGDLPRTRVEQRLAKAWEEVFGGVNVTRHSDFFEDLGGHSLLAARMVSGLRKEAAFQTLSVLDVYRHPVLSELASELEGRVVSSASGQSPRVSRHAITASAGLCGFLQIGGIYGLIGVFAAGWLLPCFAWDCLTQRQSSAAMAIFGGLLVAVLMNPAMICVAIAAKWLLIGRYRSGRHPVWGFYYLRWWLVQKLQALVPSHFLIGTPWLAVYARLMGAKIGRNVYLGTDHLGSFDLLSIGDDTSIGAEASLLGHTVRDGYLEIGSIKIGKGCFVGARSVVCCGAELADGARLELLSLLREKETIPPNQTWRGSPASAVFAVKPEPPKSPLEGNTSPAMIALTQLLGILALPWVAAVALLPGCSMSYALAQHWPGRWGLFLPIIGVSFIPTFLLEIVAFKWLLLGKVRAGSYPVASWFYLRKWFVDQLMDLSLVILGSVYATLYVVPWLRLLGASLRKFVEISTAHSTTPDLVTLEEGTFIADSVSLGAPHVESGRIILRPVCIGQRAFVGNSAVMPGGTEVAAGGLIGVASTVPLCPASACSSWLGSPPVFLPKREVNTSFPLERTYRPTRRLMVMRLSIEFLRITLPPILSILVSAALLFATVWSMRVMSKWVILAVFPAWYLGCATCACLVVIAAKWILMGRYKPGEKPLWSAFVWRTELLTALQEHVADPMLVRLLQGTPFIAWFFRALGAKIGRRVYMQTTSLTEFDLIAIGDEAVLNEDTVVQTHLFEDRVMKMDRVQIGDRCNLGTRSIILYNSEMQQDTSLGELSLMMKGEVLPAGTRWVGLPARRAE